MSSDRFKQLKEIDEESKAELDEEESNEGVGTTDSDSSKGSNSTTGGTGTTDTNESGSKSPEDSSSNGGGNVKDRNPRMAMFPPEEHKEGFDEALRKVKAVCSLSGEPEPNKLSEFSGAVLRHGYEDLEGICEELNLESAYEEYGEVIEE